MRRRPSPAAIAVALAAAVFATSVALPAAGAPRAYTAAGVAAKVRRALGLARQANTDSKRALRAARAFGKGIPGPTGPTGAAGSAGDQGFNGGTGPNGTTGGGGGGGGGGATGDQGADGTDGTDGFDGIPAAATVGGSLATTSQSFQEVPLTGNSWTQAADEVDLVFASVEVSSNSCDPTGSGFPTAGVELNLYLGDDNGDPRLLTTQAGAGTAVLATTGGTTGPAAVFEPGSSTSRRLYLEVADDCVGGGSMSVDDVDIKVVRLL